MLHYSISGKGSPYWVFIHGFLESATMWQYVALDELPGTKIAVDLPGHGRSALPEAEPSLEALAVILEQALSPLNTAPFLLVGHSMGGYVGLELVSRGILSVEKLVLLNSNCWSDSEEKKKDRVRVADIAFKGKSIFIHEAIPRLFATPTLYEKEITALKKEALELSAEGIAFASLAMRSRKDHTRLLRHNPEKFVCIHGADDALVTTEEMKARVAPCVVHVLNACGHMAHIEAPAAVLDILHGIY